MFPYQAKFFSFSVLVLALLGLTGLVMGAGYEDCPGDKKPEGSTCCCAPTDDDQQWTRCTASLLKPIPLGKDNKPKHACSFSAKKEKDKNKPCAVCPDHYTDENGNIKKFPKSADTSKDTKAKGK